MRRLIVVAVGVGVFALATPAWAHVTVASPGATRGGYAVLTFRVPCESDTASTTKLAVQLPLDHPFASVAVQPKQGWTFTTRTRTLAKPVTNDDGDRVTKAVSEIDWRAGSRASAIKPGEFDEFNVSVGPLPDTRSISFAAIQTYSDGKIVRWNQVAAPGSNAEPDYPKPTLQLATADSTDPATAPARTVVEKQSSSAAPTILAIIAIVVAAAALGVAVVGNARRRSGS